MKWTDKQLLHMYKHAKTTEQYMYASIRSLPKRTDTNVLFAYQAALNVLDLFTPRRFMRLFPVSKEYDGERWQSKDYFTTMEMIEQHGMDKPIEDAFEFLWDYVNPHTRVFLSGYMCAVDRKRRSAGKPCMLEQFFDEQGMQIPTYRKIEVAGKTILQNTATGETHAVVQPKPQMPRWWKVIEGGKKEESHA